MKKILILEDKPEAIETIDAWLDYNYPSLTSYDIVRLTDITRLPIGYVGEYDIIIFTGSVGGKSLSDTLTVHKTWQNRLFMCQDDSVDTRKFLVKLKKAGIQTMKLVTYA